MRSMRWTVLVAVISAVATAAVVPAAAAPAAKPSVKLVKRLLTPRYVDNKYADKREKIAWKTITYGSPRLGTYLSDGVPPNSRTIVHPVRARFAVRTSSSPAEQPGGPLSRFESTRPARPSADQSERQLPPRRPVRAVGSRASERSREA